MGVSGPLTWMVCRGNPVELYQLCGRGMQDFPGSSPPLSPGPNACHPLLLERCYKNDSL